MILNYGKKQFFLIAILFFLSMSHLSFGQFNSVDLHSQVDRVQPMTGIVFWSANSGNLSTLGDKVQLEYSYLVYSDVIQNQGAYNWSIVDNLLANAAANGRQMIIRFRYTYPGITTPSVPNYVRNSFGYQDQTLSVEGSSTYIPDWSSQALQDFTKEFFTAFAARYDNDSRLAFLQIGFGSYSEYHLYNGPANPLGQYFPSKSYQTEFLYHVNGLFQQTQWGISIDAAESSRTPISSNNLQSLNYGLFDDSFLHAGHSSSDSEYNRSSWLFFGQNKYQTNVAGGELSYYDGEQPLVLNPNGTNGTSFEQLAAQYHISYMIGNDQLNYQSVSRIESAGMATGYRFSVESYQTNGSTTNVTIRNTGIAPIYYDAYPSIAGTRSNTSLKGLLPNQTQTFTISRGATGEDLTIECDRLSPGQVIQFDANIDGGTTCPNAGQPCDDQNACTTGTTYDINCNCTGGTYTCGGNECIIIDQSLNDWSTIAPLSSNAGFILKAADDNNTLYISVSGAIGDFGEGYQIFLDTDNSGSEFTYYSAWSQTGFDAMIENGSFSTYTGTGSDWLWSAETPLISSKTTSGLELKIDKSLLNASSSSIRIGFVSLSNWGGAAFVPTGSAASVYNMNSALNCDEPCPDADGDGVCDADDACPSMDDALIGQPCNDSDVCTIGETYNNSCNCTGGTYTDADGDGVCVGNDPNDNDPCVPVACNGNDCIVIDQSLNDWSAINPLSSGAGFILKAADDNNTLYISVSGAIGDFGEGYQIFLDTDNSGSEFTYFSAWSQTGFDAMIENGSFSTYTGTGSDWLWSAETSIISSKTTVGLELKIDKSLLNASSSSIRIGFASLSNWGGVAFVPAGSAASVYNMSSALNCGGPCPDADGDGVCDADDACPGMDDALIGQSCNDNNACTTGDTYNANCNCIGTIQDADGDGVCDANDACPNLNNALIGTPCDDGNDCTTGEIYDTNCGCTGGTYTCNGTETTVTYTPNDDENIVNPDRGFYYPYYPEGFLNDFQPMVPATLRSYRENLFTPNEGSADQFATYQIRTGLFFRYYVLDKDETNPTVLASYSSLIQQDFDAVRSAGGRLIVRFAYEVQPDTTCGQPACPPYGDADKTTITTHIAALAQVLQDNEDVIAAVQIGFIGVWGEQFYTENFAENSLDTLTATDWTNRNEVVGALLDAVPPSRMVQIRYPQMKQKYLSGATAALSQTAINSVAMAEAEAYSETDKARLGFHNDCFLASENDLGTYKDYGPNPINQTIAQSILEPYSANDGRYTAVGGETCGLSNSFNNNCAEVAQTMQDLHYSYLNSAYSNIVNNQWGCIEEIKGKLGYRFVMQNGTYPTAASAGSTIPVTINFTNEGYAAPYNERELWMVFRGPSGTKKAQIYGANTDTRRWYPGSVATVSGSVTVPADLINGNYEMLLHILDPSSNGRIAARPEYSIQLANTGTWEAITGFNKLNHTINIGGTPPPSNGCITIDQSLSDWSTIAPLSSGAGFTVKAADDNNTLYISVSGPIGDFGEGYQLFLDTDNSGSEFTYFSAWSQTGFDAMIENGSFSTYAGTGSDWLWSAETSIISSKTTAGLELKIDKSLLNASSSNIRIGFVSLSNWGGVAFVPTGSSASAYTMNAALNCGGSCPDADGDGVCDADDACPGMDDALIGQTCSDGDVCTTGETYNNSCNCTGGTYTDADGDGVCVGNDPNDNDPCIPNSCSECIIIDQSLNDWSAINPLSSNAGFIVKAVDDNNTLYISITGTIGDFGNGYQIFLDTDNNGSEFTYYSAWSQTGFDAMIENGSFSTYTGTGSDWIWSAETPIISSKTTAGLELKIDKSLLNASSSSIRIGFASLSNWGGAAFVPAGSSASAYTLSSSLNCDSNNNDCPDSDNDGVCDSEDACSGINDAIIGTPCNDNDVCTIGETYNSNCNCAGGTYIDADADGICVGNDPNDNDPCIPIACSNECNVFDNESFDNGWGIWNDGGSDAFRYSGYNDMAYSIRLRDNSGGASSMYTDVLDMSAVTSVTIDFSYIANSMENNEDFFLEISGNGGSTYSLVEEWNSGSDFFNGSRYNETVVIEENFTSNTVFRFRCDASRNNDQIFIDYVVIEACGGEVFLAKEALLTSSSFTLYPNPAKDLLNIDFENVTDSEGTAHIFTASGQLVNQKNIPSGIHNMNIPIDRLPAGIYIIRLQFDSGTYSTQRFVKLSN